MQWFCVQKGCKTEAAQYSHPFRCWKLQKCIWRESSWSQICAWSLWWCCLCCGLEGGRSPACFHWSLQWKVLPSHHTYSALKQRHTLVHSKRNNTNLLLMTNMQWIRPYLAFSCSTDVDIVSRYPGQAEILASINSCSSPSQTCKKYIYFFNCLWFEDPFPNTWNHFLVVYSNRLIQDIYI